MPYNRDMNTAQKKIVTRFAPSPTGELHVGGARTALFNWAYARHFKGEGEFILRIEDTDQARSSDASTVNIIRDLKWMGIDYDAGPNAESSDPKENQSGENGPYFQSERLAIYDEYLAKLVMMGRAYACYKTQEEIAQDKAQAREEGRPERYDPTDSLNLSPEKIEEYEAEGRKKVMRFRMPDEDVVIEDAVLGTVRVSADELEDFVIQKSDGFPTYHFAVVVDDALMGVNHVIRGQEHLNNTPKHVALQDALEIERPTYAHIPLIFNPDGSKMSKRDKTKAARAGAKAWLKEEGNSVTLLAVEAEVDDEALQRLIDKKADDTAIAVAIAPYVGVTLPEIDVADFRASGYLPEVLCNYLARLGWSPANDQEKFDNAFLAEQFTLNRIGKSNAKFDREKLLSFNGDAIRELALEEFEQKWRAYCEVYRPEFLGQVDDESFALLAKAYQERARTLAEPCELASFVTTNDTEIEYDRKAVKKNLLKNDGEGLTRLKALEELLKGVEVWDALTLETTLKQYIDDKELNMGQVFQPLRIAVTGGTVSPPVPDTLAIIGQDRTLTRIEYCLHTVGSGDD